MTISDLSVRRPVFAAVLSIAIFVGPPCSSTPLLKTNMNGSRKPPIAYLQDRLPIVNGFAPAIDAAAKAAGATGGEMADRQAKNSMNICTSMTGSANLVTSTGASSATPIR
jgi:hypothetical protein